MIIALIVSLIFLAVSIFLLFKYKERNIKLDAEKQVLEQRIAILNSAIEEKDRKSEEDSEKFKLLATQILSEKSEEIRKKNESALSEILSPFKQDLDKLGKTVNDCYHTEARERFSLQEKIKDLIGINQLLGKEAKELSIALKGNNKVQGLWGEIILESVLEKSGLRKNEEYFLQKAAIENDEETGKLRPDVIVCYPGAKNVVIDSKTSLHAFVEYVNADDESMRIEWGQKHVESVKRHIDELAKKSYERLSSEGGADFVMMFIPNDYAYMTAMNLDSLLWQKAYDKKIIIVSPTLLMGALRIIARQWDYDRQHKNAMEIAKTAGSMYDKLVGFVTDLEKIENGINSLSRAYNDSMKKLRDGQGSLISKANKLKELGVETKKQLNS